MKPMEFLGIQTDLAQKESFYTIKEIDNASGNNFYFLSNDIYKNKLRPKKDNKPVVFVGIANPHFFHFLKESAEYSKIKRIIAVDNNLTQLRYFSCICRLICLSNNRIEYLQALFKTKFNARAIEVLSKFNSHPDSYIHGGLDSDKFYGVEKEIWANSKFDKELFLKTYGLEVTLGEAGLLIESSTIGDIDTYFATIICGSKVDYGHWPFTAAFGSGFLYDEISFQRVRKILLTVPVYQILSDISDIYENILISNRYFTTVFYSSNLLCDYFIDKHPALEKIINISRDLGTRREPNFPEIDLIILQDERTAIELLPEITPEKNHKRRLSVHTNSFSAVASVLSGNRNIEVVNMPLWIELDNGESKLPNTEYILVEEFEKLCCEEKFTSIFFHVLVGHGMREENFWRLAEKALKMTDNLIILEHNKKSSDFKKLNIGLSVEKLRNFLGMESFLSFCPGERTKDRNILVVYKNPCVRLTEL